MARFYMYAAPNMGKTYLQPLHWSTDAAEVSFYASSDVETLEQRWATYF
jgi:hypothetical protein